MVGPVQRVVYDLKARFNGDKALVRRELLRRGYRPARVSQLLLECDQFPPQNQRQRDRQSFQDRPNMKKDMIPQISN